MLLDRVHLLRCRGAVPARSPTRPKRRASRSRGERRLSPVQLPRGRRAASPPSRTCSTPGNEKCATPGDIERTAESTGTWTVQISSSTAGSFRIFAQRLNGLPARRLDLSAAFRCIGHIAAAVDAACFMSQGRVGDVIVGHDREPAPVPRAVHGARHADGSQVSSWGPASSPARHRDGAEAAPVDLPGDANGQVQHAHAADDEAVEVLSAHVCRGSAHREDRVDRGG